MSSFIHLPRSLELKDTIIAGRGIFAKEPITRAKTIFKSRPFSFGVGGTTLEQVRAICHHCMTHVRGATVVCPKWQVVGYYSDACHDGAKPLHAMECAAGTWKLRGDSTALHVAAVDDRTLRYWPPTLGHCKSWTLDFGMDSGMDYGLEYGLKIRFTHALCYWRLQ